MAANPVSFDKGRMRDQGDGLDVRQVSSTVSMLETGRHVSVPLDLTGMQAGASKSFVTV